MFREEAVSAIAGLHGLGLQVTMLTGDQQSSALEVCRRVGIPARQCHFRLMPSEKQQWILQHQQGGSGGASSFERRERINPPLDVETGDGRGRPLLYGSVSDDISWKLEKEGEENNNESGKALWMSSSTTICTDHTLSEWICSRLSWCMRWEGNHQHYVGMIGDGVNDGAALVSIVLIAALITVIYAQLSVRLCGTGIECHCYTLDIF